MYFETIIRERNERFCPVLKQNVLMDVEEKNYDGNSLTDVKCCNENQCIKKFGKCRNEVLHGL